MSDPCCSIDIIQDQDPPYVAVSLTDETIEVTPTPDASCSVIIEDESEIHVELTPSPQINVELSDVVIGGSGEVSGWSNFGQSTPRIVQVTDVGIQLLAANASRREARISNYSGKPIFVEYGVPAVFGDHGFRMNTNTFYTIDLNNLFLGPIYAITDTGDVAGINVMEGIP